MLSKLSNWSFVGQCSFVTKANKLARKPTNSLANGKRASKPCVEVGQAFRSAEFRRGSPRAVALNWSAFRHSTSASLPLRSPKLAERAPAHGRWAMEGNKAVFGFTGFHRLPQDSVRLARPMASSPSSVA